MNQSVVAMSSGEAEYYGIAKGASHALGIRSMKEVLGIRMKEAIGIQTKEEAIEICTDASAAKGIATRVGLGKLRHVEVAQLWVQDKVRKGEIKMVKINGDR